MGFFYSNYDKDSADYKYAIEQIYTIPIQQQLNFSLYAYETIMYDRNTFGNYSKEIGFSTIINKIIINYMHEAKCSVFEHKKAYLDEIQKILKIDNEKKEEEYLNCYLNISSNIFFDTSKYKKMTITLNKELIRQLLDSKNSAYYQNSRKKYLEAIINEYVSLPYYKREIIYFKEKYEKINSAIENRYIIEIEVKNKKYKICPYSIETDKSTNYNYLICSEADNSDLISFRFQNIRIVSENEGVFPKRSAETINIHKKIIEQYGAPYVEGNGDPIIKIRLSKQGFENYKSWNSQRPLTATKDPMPESDGSVILTFECSKRQIRNYFFKFGKEAVILEPADLKETFKSDYKEALAEYEK